MGEAISPGSDAERAIFRDAMVQLAPEEPIVNNYLVDTLSAELPTSNGDISVLCSRFAVIADPLLRYYDLTDDGDAGELFVRSLTKVLEERQDGEEQ